MSSSESPNTNAEPGPARDPIPLCVDLDGTLINTDMLWESLLLLLSRNPLYFFSIFAWWAKGRAHLKAEIAKRVAVNPATLPYNQPLIDLIRTERSHGRKVLLVTASDTAMAEGVAKHLPIFDEVLASDGTRNLRGKNKAATLASIFGERGFDYAGNSHVDIPVWQRARKALVVNGSPALAGRAEQVAGLGPVLPSPHSQIGQALNLLALHPFAWLPNLLIPLALLLASPDPARIRSVALAFLAFTLATYCGCVLRDFFSIPKDRLDPERKSRPLASGALKIQAGPLLAAMLALIALLTALPLGWQFELLLAVFLGSSALGQSGQRGNPVWIMLNLLRTLAAYLAIR